MLLMIPHPTVSDEDLFFLSYSFYLKILKETNWLHYALSLDEYLNIYNYRIAKVTCYFIIQLKRIICKVDIKFLEKTEFWIDVEILLTVNTNIYPFF